MRRGSGLYRDERLASAAPPALPKGAGEQSADASAVSHGGADGFPIPESHISQDGMNLWSLVLGQESAIASQICEVLQLLRDQPDHLAGARLKALAEIQMVLRQTTAATDWEKMVSVPAGDLVLITQMALQRLR